MLRVFKVFSDAILPKYATKASACFDLHACLIAGQTIKKSGPSNVLYDLEVKTDQQVSVNPGDRMLIPTGLKFHIPPNHSVRLHPRSGLAFKNGIALSNCEGVIDEDYVDPVFVCLINNSGTTFIVGHGDRICQAELIVDCRSEIVEALDAPTKKTDRAGGFGSTGI
jgi:dUTP pyrophosphatase